MGVSTKEIDRIVWAIVKASEYCYSEDGKERDKRIDICFGKTSVENALEYEISRVFSQKSCNEYREPIKEFVSLHSKSLIYGNGLVYFTRSFIIDVLGLIYTISGYSVSNYTFIYYINSFVNQHYGKINLFDLKKIYSSPIYGFSDSGFCAYYCAYTYIRKSHYSYIDATKQLKELLDVVNYSGFDLYAEIDATYYKYQGCLDGELQYFNDALDKIRNLLTLKYFQNNPAIIALFCDCVVCKLEATAGSRPSKSDFDLLNQAISKIQFTETEVPDYATYPLQHGKLLYLKAIHGYENDADEKIRVLMDAKSKFSAAEKLIERSSYDYFPRSRLISNLNSKCDIQIETLESKKDISRWVNNKIGESEKEIQSIRETRVSENARTSWILHSNYCFDSYCCSEYNIYSVGRCCDECIGCKRGFACYLSEYYCPHVGSRSCSCSGVWITDSVC